MYAYKYTTPHQIQYQITLIEMFAAYIYIY